MNVAVSKICALSVFLFSFHCNFPFLSVLYACRKHYVPANIYLILYGKVHNSETLITVSSKRTTDQIYWYKLHATILLLQTKYRSVLWFLLLITPMIVLSSALFSPFMCTCFFWRRSSERIEQIEVLINIFPWLALQSIIR